MHACLHLNHHLYLSYPANVCLPDPFVPLLDAVCAWVDLWVDVLLWSSWLSSLFQAFWGFITTRYFIKTSDLPTSWWSRAFRSWCRRRSWCKRRYFIKTSDLPTCWWFRPSLVDSWIYSLEEFLSFLGDTSVEGVLPFSFDGLEPWAGFLGGIFLKIE